MSRHPTSFLAPDGTVVSRDAWQELQQTPEAYVIHKFENDKISVVLTAADKMPGTHAIPREHWMMFHVNVWNIISTDAVSGETYDEPRRIHDVNATTSFRTLEEAQSFYTKFLASYTESHFDEATGELVELGNIFAPPDPDVPTVSGNDEAAEVFGSW